MKSKNLSDDRLSFLRLICSTTQSQSDKKSRLNLVKNNSFFRQNRVVQAGWKGETESETETVKWEKGMRINPDFTIKKELSVPPKPLTEASLLGPNEKYSLGTPATRAEIIEKLIKSELMERTPQGLQASPKGKQLLVLVNPSLVTPDLTESWEKDLGSDCCRKETSRNLLEWDRKRNKTLGE